MTGLLRRDDSDGVAPLTIHRPERLNSFTAADYHELHVALEACLADDSIGAVTLTGVGRAFSAGADRSLLEQNGQADDRTRAGAEFTRLLDVLRGFDKPLFAAVNGVAVGFGATMLLYCDLVVMAETARLRLPFTELGIVPEAGSSALLPLRARWPDIAWALFSSEWIGAAAAVKMGLVWRCVPDEGLPETTLGAARHVAGLDGASVRATKRLLTAGRTAVSEAAVARETEALGALLSSPKRSDSSCCRLGDPACRPSTEHDRCGARRPHHRLPQRCSMEQENDRHPCGHRGRCCCRRGQERRRGLAKPFTQQPVSLQTRRRDHRHRHRDSGSGDQRKHPLTRTDHRMLHQQAGAGAATRRGASPRQGGALDRRPRVGHLRVHDNNTDTATEATATTTPRSPRESPPRAAAANGATISHPTSHRRRTPEV